MAAAAGPAAEAAAEAAAAAAAARVGLAFDGAFAPWLHADPSRVELLEVRADRFLASGRRRLQALAADHALALRGGSLSLGSAGPLDGPSLEWLAGLIEISRPLWLSEPIGFWRSSEMTLADVCPIRFDFANLELLAEHARAAQERLRVPLLLENVASPLRIRGTLADAEFLNRLCEASSCRLLVDLGALVAQARGHGFDAEGWLRELAPANVGALRLASCPRRWSAWLGESGAALWEATWELARSALLRLRPAAVLLAYDEGLPHPSQLAPALARLAQLAATGGAAGAR